MAPNAITRSAGSTCEKGRQPEQAMEILDRMKLQGVEPNVITYNAMISACEKGNKLEWALGIFAAMRQH